MNKPIPTDFSIIRPSRRWLTPGAIAVVLVFAIVFPLTVNPAEKWWNLLFQICLYIAIGQSWNMLGGFAGQTSLGHAAFFGIGLLLTRVLWFSGLPFVVALIASAVAAAVFALVIGVPTFRLRGAYFAIGTLAMAEVLRITIAQNLPKLSSMSKDMLDSYDLPSRYWVALSLAVVTCVVAYLLLRSRWGLGLMGVREDEEAAQASGVHVLRHKLLALVISALFMGLAGGVLAFHQVSYYPGEAFFPSWTFHAMMIAYVGGVGTIAGPIVGGIFYVVARYFLASNPSLTNLHWVIFGTLFILVVLLLPGGLMQLWGQMKKGLARVWDHATGGSRGP